ncbi:MAG: ATP12 family protein [Sphingopyxis sp.]|nr:ATP12 family protein [Sphingopyxis sp.]
MKRFWKAATVGEDAAGFAIHLDGRAVRTPARAPLIVPTRALADAIAAEWQAQGEEIDPRAMPLTGLANAAIDHAARDPAAFAATLLPYAETDLLCYRDDRDAVLAAEQAAAWNPLLAWAEARWGVEFMLAQGIIHVAQPSATIARMQSAVTALPPFRLAALSPLVTISGSLVAALAVEAGERDAAGLWPVVCLDQLYQERRWGHDTQAALQRAAHERDWLNAAQFLSLL